MYSGTKDKLAAGYVAKVGKQSDTMTRGLDYIFCSSVTIVECSMLLCPIP